MNGSVATIRERLIICNYLQDLPVLARQLVPDLKCGVAYFAFRLRTHSAMPVITPNMNSGKIHSVDAPNVYATIANTQQEPTIHNAIAKESGSLAMYALSGRC